ncbi:MAG: cupin domain-containing protein [Bacteroidota bacterium]
MLIKSTDQVESFAAGDLTQIKELLHPDKDGLTLAYSLAHASLAPNTASLPHHLNSSEVYYMLKGEGRMHIGGSTQMVKKGDIVYIPPFAAQYIENTGSEQLEFLCIVDPAWRAEEEEVYDLSKD